MGLPVVWLSHHRKKESRESFAKAVINALRTDVVISRLREIIQSKSDAVDVDTTSDKQFDTPAWAFWRANVDGKKTAYNEILKLLETPDHD
jgi:hypothetical protein